MYLGTVTPTGGSPRVLQPTELPERSSVASQARDEQALTPLPVEEVTSRGPLGTADGRIRSVVDPRGLLAGPP